MCFVNIFDKEITSSDVTSLYTNYTESALMTIGIENENGYVNSDRIVLWPGAGQGFVGINTKTPTCALDMRGQMSIYEAVGTVATTVRKGTFTLLHGDLGGVSSIMFPSAVDGNDYGYIQFEESGSGSGKGVMVIGAENNVGSSTRDVISLFAANGVGNVGINTKTPLYTLDVSGNVNATSYNATSDYRVKTDVMALDASFNVDVLRPVTYTNTRHGSQDVGFIAHEIQEHYPFLVNGQKDGEQMQSLNYIGLIGILTKEIKDLKRRLAETESKVTSVETDVRSIENNIEEYGDIIISVENKVSSVENKVSSVENKVSSVENTVLLEQARLTICETDIALNKSAIKDLDEKLQS